MSAARGVVLLLALLLAACGDPVSQPVAEVAAPLPAIDAGGRTCKQSCLGRLRGLALRRNAASDDPQVACDAGDAAFVRRLIPVLWGRRAHGAAEVDVLAQVAGQLGRDGLVRAMARSPEYVEHWRRVVADILHVARAAERSNPPCYGRSLLPSGPELAAFVRDNRPDAAGWPTAWSMRDLIESALRLDDLSPVYRANLFAHLTKDFSTANAVAAKGFNDTRVQDFMRTYLNRKSDCLVCHSSRLSVTDNPDPALDRTWQVPGWFEEAVFGAPTGRPEAWLRRFFRRKGVLAGWYYDSDRPSEEQVAADQAAAVSPWGLSPLCGTFVAPDKVPPDDVDTEAWFIAEAADNASAWSLEALLDAGFASLRGGEATLPAPGAADQSLEGQAAFVWLVAMSLADRVWEEVHGQPLTIAHGFPRLKDQRDVLAGLAQAWVQHDYSLVALLTATVTHPSFNQLPPAACAAGDRDDYLPPLAVPWGDDAQLPGEIRNTPAQRIQRLPASTLLNAVTSALGWAPPQEFFLDVSEEPLVFQTLAGGFVRPPSPGFRGTSFQLGLAWEKRYAGCRPPVDEAICPLIPTLQAAFAGPAPPAECPMCGSQADALCEWDSRCCGVNWADYCPVPCPAVSEPVPESEDFRSLPDAPRPPPEGDFIGRLLAAGAGRATLGDAVAALRDRLLADPTLDADEAAILADVAGRSLDAPLAGGPEDDDALRRVCGVLLASPQFLLSGTEAGAATARPTLEVPGTGFGAVCEALGGALFTAPQSLDCTGGRAVVVTE